MKFKKIINVLMGTKNEEEDYAEGLNYYGVSGAVTGEEEEEEEYAEEEAHVEEEYVEEEEYIGDLPESAIRDIFLDLYSQLDIQPTQGVYGVFLDGWRDGLVNIETTTVKSEISAPKNMDEFANLCMAFKGMLEEQLDQELDINFVRGYCYCLCFFMPNK